MLDLFEAFGYPFVLLASLWAMWTSHNVKRTFRRCSQQSSRLGITGEEAARRVLSSFGVQGVSICPTEGELTDHFDPRNRTIYLSQSVYHASTVAAIGVAAHEAGHAVQHAVGYFPIRLRTAIVPVTNFGSRLSMPLILVGLVLGLYTNEPFGFYVALAGVFCFSLCVIFQLVTLPTEFDASHRAIRALESEGVLVGDEEISGTKKTLRAAAMTYVAALTVSVMQFLHLLARVTAGRRR